MLHSVQHDSVCHSERSEESNFYLYPLSLLSYLFALFSKEMAITLPFLIFFFDYIALHRHNQIDHPSIPSFARRGQRGGKIKKPSASLRKGRQGVEKNFLTKEHEYISPSLTPSPYPPERGIKGRGKFPRPLWERAWVRGVFVSIL